MQVVEKPADTEREALPLPVLLRIPEWAPPKPTSASGPRTGRLGTLLAVALAGAAGLWLGRSQGWIATNHREQAPVVNAEREIQTLPTLKPASSTENAESAARSRRARLAPTIVPIDKGGAP